MGLFRRQNIVTRADKISEFTVNTAEYGSAVPEVIGTTRISGNVIYYDDFTAHEHKETTKSGKGGGSKQTNITYTYTVAVILGLCEGEISGIGKVWRGKEIYDYPNDKIELTAFLGTQNQQPWAYVVGKHPEKAMPYAGLAYMAGVVDMGNSASLPQFNFEIKGKLLSTGDGVDANPADYIRYVLDKVGLSNVPVDGLDNYRSFCAEADLLISSPPDSNPKQAQAIINDICKLTNAYFYWSNDRFRIVPVETRPVGEWTPDTTIRYNLTADDFLPQSNGAMVTYSRKDSSEVYNSFPLEFINRENGYEKETVNYQLSQDILDHGLRQASTTQAHYFYKKERAVKVAEMLAHKAQIERNTYTFKLDWAFCRLEPADIVTITDPNIGVENLAVRITSVNEDAKVAIVCTAVEVDNVSGVAEYDVHNVDRPYVDFNAPPSDVTQALIIQPPADVTLDGLELWIGATGGENWGGCTVWVSDDNINYRSIGQLNNSARIGELQESMTADATSCVVSCNDVLISGTQQDAERGNTLIWIGGECLSYTTATMLQDGNYRLDGLIRGQYNTTATAHAAGEQFARLDGTLLRESFRKEDVGKKIWLKFCSYNIFGAKEQSLADVQPYQYTLQAYYVPPVLNVTARNRYRQIQDGVARYDIVVSWTPPNLQSYLEGQVWYKTDHGQTVNINDVAGIPVSQLGFQGDWIFGGSGKNQVVIPQAVVGDTYEIAVTTVDKWAASTDPDLAPKVRITVAMKTMVPNTPDGFGITYGNEIKVSWKEVANTDIAFYEVRDDVYCGNEDGHLLARTSGTLTTLTLTTRTGTLFLFAKSALGKYSAPAVLEYFKNPPAQPSAPQLVGKLGGFSVQTKNIPAGCTGMQIYISSATDTEAFSPNTIYQYPCGAGIYDVQIAYVDYFGAGEKSASSRIVVKELVDSKLLEAQAVTKEKLEAGIQDAVDAAKQSVFDIQRIDGTITSVEEEIAAIDTATQDIVTELGKAPANCGYRSISDLKTTTDNISLTVATNKTTQDGINTTIGSRLDVHDSGISAITTNLNKAAGSTGYAALTQLSTSVAGIQAQVEEIYEMTDEGIAPDIATMKSQITQNSNSINSMVETLNSSPSSGTQYSAISQLKQQADSISSTVQSNKTAQDKVNAGTASSGLLTKINQNTSSITAVANRTTETENDIAALEVRADGISSTVTSNKTEQDDINESLTSQISQNKSSINLVVSNLKDIDKATSNYAALRIMNNVIGMKVTQDDVSSWFQQDHKGFYIQGSLINIDGTTKIGNNVISKNMIQSNAVTADKMAVDSLSAITANVGSLKGGTITGTQIVGTNFKNSSGSFTVDDHGNVKGINITAGTITADVIKQSGFKITAVTGLKGTLQAPSTGKPARDWVTIPLPAGYSENECVWGAFPLSLSTYAVNGRKVRCYTAAGENDPNEYYSLPIWYWIIGIKGINT